MKVTQSEIKRYLAILAETPLRIPRATEGLYETRSALIFERKQTDFTQTRRLARHEQEHVEQMALLLREA